MWININKTEIFKRSNHKTKLTFINQKYYKIYKIYKIYKKKHYYKRRYISIDTISI